MRPETGEREREQLNMAAISWLGVVYDMLKLPETLVALFCFYFTNSWYRQRQQQIFSWPLLGMLPTLLMHISCLYDWIVAILEPVGGTYLFKGPALTNMEFLVTSDPTNIEHILKTNFPNYPKGDAFFEIFYDLFGNGIGTADSEAWLSLRRNAHKLVHSKDFRYFVARTTDELVRTKLIPILEGSARLGSVIDLQDVLLRFTFDSTCITVLGTDPGCLSPCLPAVPIAKAMDDVMESILYRHLLPGCCWKLLRRLKLGKEKQLANAKAAMEEYVADHVAQAKAMRHKGSDVLSHYVTISKDDTFLRDTAVNFLVAGRDTSGTALSWFFWLVSQHPKVEAKLLEELRGIVGARRRDEGSSFTEEELKNMVYLHATICETLRLYPPAPIESKTALKEDVLPDGTVVKPGVTLFYIIYAVGRMKWVWGQDCMEFKPERWFDDHGLPRHESNSFRFLAFNAGPRTCVGKDMAFVQMKHAAAHILLNFCIEVVQGHSVSPKPSVIMTMKNGLLTRVRKRNRSS